MLILSDIMRLLFVAILVMAVATLAPVFGQEGEPLAERKQAWQAYLENTNFHFDNGERGLIKSLQGFESGSQLHFVVGPSPKHEKYFEFVRNGKTVVSLPGHIDSVFLTSNDKLYFANFHSLGAGCSVVAYNLIDGKKLWETGDISKQGPTRGFTYRNLVQMRFSRPNQVANEPDSSAIILKGVETFGHYLAVLDRDNGALLAHKIYGTGFGGDHPARITSERDKVETDQDLRGSESKAPEISE
jgi:hypothetical protein